ncbi:transposase [Streptomyces sp. P9(2023)]|uniref:transposase n=1 Tax=Streptomyces sp. P9(2023) TaxID=3064394 RepID=UPI0028F40EBF|nr:transposase [Streptomyces sp. P9(2023)]MDT9688901.1 transposase [Streptomyces sp. P9(2023)]
MRAVTRERLHQRLSASFSWRVEHSGGRVASRSSTDGRRSGHGRPPVWPRRQLINGVRFRVHTGVPWRDVPGEYGPWGRIYDLFRRWQRDGTWHLLLTRLQSLADAKGAIAWDLGGASTVCRAHQHAAEARKQGDLQKELPGTVFTEPGEHGLGRSRGGFTTNLHLAVERGPKAHVARGDRWAARELAAVRVGAGEGPRAPHRAGPAHGSALIACGLTRPTPPGRTGPTCAAAGSAAPSPTGPTMRVTPARRGLSRRPTSAIRPGRLPRASCGRIRDQPPQEAPCRRHPVRRTRRPLRSVRAGRSHQRTAVTGTWPRLKPTPL